MSLLTYLKVHSIICTPIPLSQQIHRVWLCRQSSLSHLKKAASTFCMETRSRPSGGGVCVCVCVCVCVGGGDGSQLAMMEFPLFPVFLRAAVQTPPVPWGWAGLGKSACLPITHLTPPPRGSRALRTCSQFVLGLQMTKSVCSALLHFLSLAHFPSVSGTNACWALHKWQHR